VSYAVLIALWAVLHACLGDAPWWLALLNAFAPLFFLPLVLLLPLALICRCRAARASVALPILIFTALYGPLYLPAWPMARAAEGETLTVMTFNLWGGSRQAETARAVLDNGAPDVVALQELSSDMVDVLLSEVGDAYPRYVFSPAVGFHGMGVLSRYPLAELEADHLVHPDWRIQIVRVKAPGGPVILYNVHPFSSNVILYIEQGAPIPERVRDSFRAREALLRTLAADVERRSEPVIVAGDFNTTDRSDAYAILSAHVADAHRSEGWGMGHTFPAYAGRYRGIPIVPRQMRIDMIFHSQELVPLRCKVGTAYGESDHLPVVAEFGWR
jgi:endonuclease/exonuclease/phosphatase (EEP) superfamily protein YafD